MARDLSFNSVQLLLHGVGANNGTIITDSSSANRSASRSGNVVTSTDQLLFNETSIKFDGTGDWLTYNSFPTFSGDFTFECWVRLAAAQTQATLISKVNDFHLKIGTNDYGIVLYTWTGTVDYQVSHTFNANTWYWIGVKRVGTTVTFYVNGVLINTRNSSPAFGAVSSNAIVIGGYNNNNTYSLNGFLKDFRLTLGVARDLTIVPTEPLSDYLSGGYLHSAYDTGNARWCTWESKAVNLSPSNTIPASNTANLVNKGWVAQL